MLPAAVRMPAMCHPLASLHATRRLVRAACCATHAATLHVARCRCMSYVASGRRLQQRALVGEERLRLDLDRLLRLIRIGPQCRAAAAAAAWAGGLLSGLAALPGGPEGLGDRKRALQRATAVATQRNGACTVLRPRLQREYKLAPRQLSRGRVCVWVGGGGYLEESGECAAATGR